MATPLLHKLMPIVRDLPKGHVLLLRLDGVKAMADFAQMVVQNLVCRPDSRLIKEKMLVLVNPDPGTMVAIHLALDVERDASMVLDTTVTPWELSYVGRLQPYLEAVLSYVRSHGGVTSKDIADEFNYKLADASRRLKELYEEGMLRRTPSVSSDGKLTFVYSYFHPAIEAGLETDPRNLPYKLFAPQRHLIALH
jgi:hypothetical protein